MNNPKDTQFPWFDLLRYALIWCFVAMLILSFLTQLFQPIFVMGEEARLDFRVLLTGKFWWGMFIATFINLLIASIVLIPSFYAGMYACVQLEKKGGHYETSYETTFRVTATITFFIIAAVALTIMYGNGVEILQITQKAIILLIIYYIFDDNVAEEVWPRVFEPRTTPKH